MTATTADPCHVVSPPAGDHPADPSAARYARNRDRADGVTNRHLRLLAGLLAVAADVADRLPVRDWPDAPTLRYDLAGIGWQLDLAAGMLDAIIFGPPDRPDGGTHAADLEALVTLAEALD